MAVEEKLLYYICNLTTFVTYRTIDVNSGNLDELTLRNMWTNHNLP
jgi:hypothetical protein